MLKERSTYEMRPEDVGIWTELVLGKHSGRHALKQRVTDLGYRLTDEQLNRVFEEFKNLADKKKEIYDADIEALAENQLQAGTGNLWTLIGFTSTAGTGSQTSAAVTLKHLDGTVRRDAAVGNGPIDALIKAINRITGVAVKVVDYRVRSSEPGHGRTWRGKHRDPSKRVSVPVPRVGLDVVKPAAPRSGEPRRFAQVRDRLKPPTTSEPKLSPRADEGVAGRPPAQQVRDRAEYSG